MNFKHDFETALHASEDYHTLMELVSLHIAQGMSVDVAYEALHQIWLEHGFDKGCADSTLQDNLEAVMEKVWYGFVA